MEIRRLYHEQLETLKADTVRLASLVQEAIGAGTEAFLTGDLSGAEAVIARDRDIDTLTYATEEHAYLVLARQNPMASDLRTVIAVLRVIHEIERSGDLIVNVAKATRRLHPHRLDPKISGIIEQMGEQAVNQMRLAITAFAEEDVEKASAIADMDDVMDDLQKALFRTIFAAGADDEAALQRAVQVALVGRYFERMADHAVNVAERARFIVTGAWRGGEDLTAEDA